LSLTWSYTAGYYDRYYAEYPVAEFLKRQVPAADTATRRELHFNRVGCCYYIPWGTTAAWETYEGIWRFGAVPDDGGQAELGVPPILRMRGPRTDAPQAEPADFTAEVAAAESIVTTRWWFVRAANNVFDGERVDSVATGTPYPPYIPRYPEAKRAAFTELGACAGQRTCTYQAPEAGAVLVQATLASGGVLAARNTGRSGAHVRITADSTTLAYGDTTVFRVTAPGAGRLEVMGYSFVPVTVVAAEAGQAMGATAALRRAGTMVRQGNDARRPEVSRLPTPSSRPDAQASPSARTPVGVTVVRGRTKSFFLDAAFECSEATDYLCFDNPLQTGYEVVTAKVDGEMQRDSVLVTVVPGLMVSCSPIAPIRRTMVHCSAMMSDSSEFTVTRLRSSVGGTTIVDSTLESATTQTRFTWSGLAIAATRVEIQGIAGAVNTRGEADFIVVKDTARFRDAV
jgi:hypothetical protein